MNTLWDYNTEPTIKNCLIVQSDHPPVTKYQPHSETSREAAKAISPTAGTLRTQVLEYIASRGERGATDEEVQDALGMNPSTQRPRRVELAERHLITKHGTRPTRSGRQAAVWVAVKGAG